MVEATPVARRFGVVCYGSVVARPSLRRFSGIVALRHLSFIRGARLGVARTVCAKRGCPGATLSRVSYVGNRRDVWCPALGVAGVTKGSFHCHPSCGR